MVDELQQLRPDDETKQKMLDILKRFHSEEEMDDMDEDGMSIRSPTNLLLFNLLVNSESYGSLLVCLWWL